MTYRILLGFLLLFSSNLFGKAVPISSTIAPSNHQEIAPPPAVKKKKCKRKQAIRTKLKRKKKPNPHEIIPITALAIRGAGVILFIVGVIFSNPWIWVTGLIICALSVGLLWIFGIQMDLNISILVFIEVLLGISGIVLFVIGLLHAVLAFWLGGIIFFLGALVLLIITLNIIIGFS